LLKKEKEKMSTLEQKKNTLLKDILKSYFSTREVNEFTKKYLNNSSDTTKPITGKKNNKPNEIDLQEDTRLRIDTDLLITFAESKLNRNKFLELLLSLGQMAITAGEYSLAIDINEKLLNETKGKKEYLNITANAFLSLGELNSRQAHWQLSFNNIKKAGELFDKQKDSYRKAKSENLLGTIYGEMGDLKKAKKYFENSLVIIGSKQDISLKGKIKINLGIINNIQGNYELALSYFQRALLNFQKLNNLKRIAEIEHNIGMTYLKLNKYEMSLNNFDQSISVSLQAGYLTALGITYISKAYLYTLKKDFSSAEAYADKAMDICYKTNDKLSIAEIYKIKGIIQKNKSNYESSENFLLTSLRINREFGNKLNFAETNFELGLLFKETGNGKECKTYFDEAMKYFKSISALPEIKIIMATMSS
jgi:tetratricopeptide (TPR) repeat protein